MFICNSIFTELVFRIHEWWQIDGSQSHRGLTSDPWVFKASVCISCRKFTLTLYLVIWSFLFNWPKYQGWEYFKILLSVLNSQSCISVCRGPCLSIIVLLIPWAPRWKAPAFKSHNIKQYGVVTVDWKLSRKHKGKVTIFLEYQGLSPSLWEADCWSHTFVMSLLGGRQHVRKLSTF